jgi:hypothetical protein
VYTILALYITIVARIRGNINGGASQLHQLGQNKGIGVSLHIKAGGTKKAPTRVHSNGQIVCGIEHLTIGLIVHIFSP